MHDVTRIWTWVLWSKIYVLLLFNSFNPFLPFHYIENEQQVLNGKFVQLSVDKWLLKLKKVTWKHSPWSTEGTLMYVEHLTGWGITLYCLSGHKNLNQRNKGNSPVTLAAENLHCHRPDAFPCGANYLETKRRVPCETFAVHSFLSVQVPKTTASQRRQEPQSRFREVRGRPSGCCLNSRANIGPASWRSPHMPFLEKPWPALPSRESSFSGCLALTIYQTESLQGFFWLLCES